VRLFIFESNATTGLQAFAGDVAGRNLPDQFSPWGQIGAVASGNAPPYNLSRDTFEKAISALAFSSGASNQRSHKARRLRLTQPSQRRVFGTILVAAPLTNVNSNIRRRGVTQFKAEESFMTSKDEAELLFKQQQLSGGPRSIPEYEQRALAERTKIAKLRVLRLPREAELTMQKRAPQKPSRTLRRGTRSED
jgi:hypothetical protein